MIISLYFFHFSKDFDNGDGRKCYFIRGWTYISEVSMNINCIDKREMMSKYEISDKNLRQFLSLQIPFKLSHDN